MSENYDANDVARRHGLDEVRKAFDQRRDTLPPVPPYEDEGADDSTFEILTASQLEALPPPNWLIHERVAEDGLTVLYGEPGSAKTFIGLDMGLRIAIGMDWHGEKAKKTGVLYIAGEGARGIGKRITGWRMKHQIQMIDAPFVVLPTAVQLLEPGDVAKLLRTIDEAKRQLWFDVGLVIVDTVSRSMVGADENTQETMTRFVAACDAIKKHTGGAVIGIHHSGKDKDRGMRGSSVLLGACDGAIRVEKADKIVTLKIEKQKDAEEAPPLHMELERYTWFAGSEDDPGEEISTLVPVKSEYLAGQGSLSREFIIQAFGMMTDAWIAGKPLSSKPQTKRDGRYAPAVLAARIGGDADTWEAHILSWLDTGCIAYEVADKNTKLGGLKVLDPVM